MIKIISWLSKNLQIVLICFSAWMSVVAFYLSDKVTIYDISGQDAKKLMWLILFAALVAIYRKAIHIGQKREKVAAAVIALLFAFLFTIGAELAKNSSLGGLTSIFGLLKIFVSVFGYGVLFYALIILFFIFAGKSSFAQTNTQSLIWFSDNRRSFFTTWAVIFICWLPYLIIFFPGIFSTDSMVEFGMGLGTETFSAHHTIIHTLLMSAFIRLGAALGSYNLGTALYSITQMAVMSAIFSFVLRYLAYRNVRLSVRVLLLAYFALYPVNALYSITGWKDIIFGGLCLLLFIMLVEIFRRPHEMLYSKYRIAAICIVSILFALFRNNAVYALVLFVPFFLFALQKYWKRLVPMVLVCAFAIYVFNWCAFSVFNIRKPDVVEAMSVPLQQIARTVTAHKEKLTQRELDELSRYFLVEELPKLYNPRLSNPVKWEGFKAYEFQRDATGFVKIWAQLGLKYTQTYISSFLYNSYGYWYPDVDYWIYGTDVYLVDHIQLRSANLFPGLKLFAQNVIGVLVRKAPVLSMLSSIGFMVWLIILSAGVIIGKRVKNIIVPMLLPGFVWFTTLASPVFAEYRYVYGVILCAPVIFVLSILETDIRQNTQI
jgi:hypothetical protein